MSNVRKNYIYNVIYQLLAVIFPLITSPYISRILQAEGLGIYSYTFSIVQYFILFSMLGIKNYGVRSIARVKDDKEQVGEFFVDENLTIKGVCQANKEVKVFIDKEDYSAYEDYLLHKDNGKVFVKVNN